MDDLNQFASTKKLLDSANSVIIILPGEPTPDMVAAGLSLHLSLKASGKRSQIGCGSEVQIDPKVLGGNEITDSIGANNLVISFDYLEENLEKVDYDVRPDGKFYLMIKPKAGAPVPDISNVKYSYSGAVSDLVITFGVNSFEELGKIYADEKSFLDEAKILSLNLSPRPATFTPHLLHRSAGSFSELVTELLEKSDLKPSPDAANNLLTSIYTETKNLTGVRMTADTFAGIAFLMRHGAKLPGKQAFAPRFSQPAFFESPVGAIRESPASIPPSTPSDEDGIPLPPEEDSSPEPVPADWTRPKVFRATDL